MAGLSPSVISGDCVRTPRMSCTSVLTSLHSVPLLASAGRTLLSQTIIKRCEEERARDIPGEF